MTRFSTTGVWPGDEPRRAASSAFTHLAEGLPSIPLVAVPAQGGTRWAVDSIGPAVSLLDQLPADLGPFGWRLSRGAGRDVRVERSRFGRTLDAVAEYGEGFAGAALLSLPGPWTLARALSLPDSNRALSDPGAVRDIIQAYAAGVQALRERCERLLGTRPRIRLWEPVLDQILTGSVPTVSGFRTLPALPERTVLDALRSFLVRSGEGTLVTVPQLAAVRLAGKEVAHREQLREAGVAAVCVPFAGLDLQGWEELAQAQEAGTEVWVRLPASAGEHPGDVKAWLAALTEPWKRIGMDVGSLAEFGILTGWELPLDLPPLLPETAAPTAAEGGAMLASRISQALKELA
ncbi:methionine synthase [Brevibacterium daeguense]|uniref:Methionine synthase n=1 Tax=Brevibacterium daeguense TaxID=909936 RepID=A0ABP8ELK9_9MICO|nr:hypothetical protein [Brevibacterium daeguense]